MSVTLDDSIKCSNSLVQFSCLLLSVYLKAIWNGQIFSNISVAIKRKKNINREVGLFKSEMVYFFTLK